MKDVTKESYLPLHIHHREPLFQMHRAFDDALENIFSRVNSAPLPFQDMENFLITPSIDIVDEKDQIKIEAEMPGMGPEDITLSLAEGSLTIRGKKTTAKKDKGKDYVRREINYGSYLRTISLPETVDIDKATASFKKGMLWVILPKKAEDTKQARQIKIEKA